MSTEISVAAQGGAGLDRWDSALLETLLKEAPIGFALFDEKGRFRRVNRTLSVIYGLSESECADRSPAEILAPSDAAAHEEALRGVLAGAPVVYSDHLLLGGTAEQPRDDRHWAMSWFPATDRGTGAGGVALIAVDLSERHRTELALRRGEERYRSLLHAGNQMVWAARPEGDVHEDCPEWRRVTGQTPEEFLGHGWLGAVHPEDREPVRRAWNDAVAAGETFEAAFRVRARSGDHRHYRSRAVPLMRGGELVEWVGAHTDITHQREAEEMRQRLTRQLGEAALRTVRLQKATAALAEALTVEQVVRAITEICHAKAGADRVEVVRLDGERLRFRPLAPEEGDPPPGETGLDRPGVVAEAVRDRRPFIAESPHELRRLLGPGADGETEAFLSATAEKAWVGLPLLSAGSPIGALRLAFHRPRGVSDDERVFLEALAGQCSLALQRAEMFEREHRTAEALQRSLLPEQLPEVPGVRLAALYRSGSEYVQVGGDWYDAFPLADGRVAAVLGDVMGKGIEAATGMSRVRNALRALALTLPEPADVLTGLDRLFAATEREEQVTTLAYAVLDPVRGSGTLGSAGHLPPLMMVPGAAPFLVETEPGTPLGMPAEREQHDFFAPPGNTVVLYSDGLVENRERGLLFGLRELVTVASNATPEVVRNPDALLTYLVEHMLAGYEQDDDVTLLAVHVPVTSR